MSSTATTSSTRAIHCPSFYRRDDDAESRLIALQQLRSAYPFGLKTSTCGCKQRWATFTMVSRGEGENSPLDSSGRVSGNPPCVSFELIFFFFLNGTASGSDLQESSTTVPACSSNAQVSPSLQQTRRRPQEKARSLS